MLHCIWLREGFEGDITADDCDDEDLGDDVEDEFMMIIVMVKILMMKKMMMMGF